MREGERLTSALVIADPAAVTRDEGASDDMSTGDRVVTTKIVVRIAELEN